MKKLNHLESGITLIALVVTIIVLLILAGVSIGLVFNSDGLFEKASSSTEKYNQQKAEEALRGVLSDAQLEKYGAEGLTDEKLDEKINQIGQVDEEENNKVIVDGYIFEIDRSVPEIVKYLERADGIIISYKIIGNDNWITEGEKDIIVNVTIKDNGGPLDTRSIKVIQDETDITSTINVSTGKFTLNTNKSTTYVITANNSKGEPATPKEIVVKAKVDTVIPSANLETEWLNENGKDLLEIKVNNIEDLDSGINLIKLFVTKEGEETLEKELTLQKEIITVINDINMESFTKIELYVSDIAGNVLTIKKDVRRIYLVKNRCRNR